MCKIGEELKHAHLLGGDIVDGDEIIRAAFEALYIENNTEKRFSNLISWKLQVIFEHVRSVE
jgi:hypothetical protein